MHILIINLTLKIFKDFLFKFYYKFLINKLIICAIRKVRFMIVTLDISLVIFKTTLRKNKIIFYVWIF